MADQSDSNEPENEYPILVSTFYNFSPLTDEQLDSWEERFYQLAETTDLMGLIISAPEGFNSTLAGRPATIESAKRLVQSIPGFSETIFKDSHAQTNPFKRFKIKRRTEIVTLKKPEFAPSSSENNHLSPDEWEKILREEEDFVLIDTRNGYEVDLGSFEGAIDPQTHMFSEFGDYVQQSGIPKEKKVLMYCTGGIRCEKAIFEMQEQGYKDVYQLEGGILNYLKQYPNSKFKGECFVFDHRVAVDQNLLPSQNFRLCPHCGDPGASRITCEVCDTRAVVCKECLRLEYGSTCSKNCSYHYQVNSSKKGAGENSK